MNHPIIRLIINLTDMIKALRMLPKRCIPGGS
ncbi:MAG: hypothetical protein K0S56_1830 [Microvirga sp.]|nr:hypothetical protein [Microvirga sp.]